MKTGFVIAIDGPVAAGKGTIAPALARILQGFYLYTGAMYRGLALSCLEQGISLADTNAVINASNTITIRFSHDRVLLNGKDVTKRLKEPDIAEGSPLVAALPRVRERMVQMQQEIAQREVVHGTIVVAEGRDTGTKVFPDAALKIFLTASVQARTARRLEQYHKQGVGDITFATVHSQIEARDRQDQERATDPLSADPVAAGYVVVDNSELTQHETIETIQNELKKRHLL